MASRRPSNRRRGASLERYFTLRESAQYVRVSVSTLADWTRRGLVARIKLPGKMGKVLIKESDLIEFMERYRQPAREEVLDRVWSDTGREESKGEQ
ncbi:MAG: helix-turn-helix domain-containing protein [Planctomycetota bacterium]|nr:helix-turn-helix domain-containing protein [Planctomycetota bacterium]